MGAHRVPKYFPKLGKGFGVEFELRNDLYLRVRSSKSSLLVECDCRIPSLMFDAQSVSEAYARISTEFEPSRRSHTGNVFNCVFIDQDFGLAPLAELRLKLEEDSADPDMQLSSGQQSTPFG